MSRHLGIGVLGPNGEAQPDQHDRMPHTGAKRPLARAIRAAAQRHPVQGWTLARMVVADWVADCMQGTKSEPVPFHWLRRRGRAFRNTHPDFRICLARQRPGA